MQPLIRRRAEAPLPQGLADLHPVLARVFASRGVERPEELGLGLENLLPPDSMTGIDEAAALLADCIAQNHSILIIGDFDADGATSTAVAVSLLRGMGAGQVDYLVPNRFEFGYGLTPEIVELASARNPQLIVTVDNGISSIAGVQRARELGIRTLVTDHHLPAQSLPAADVIVNPNQPGCRFPAKNLAGVGVIFYVMSALRGELRRRGWFDDQGISEPNLAEVLDLVALGTVADVVPLDYNNRILVQQGLLRIRAGRTRPGLSALLDVAARPAQRLVAADLAFAVAPRLNAAGRLDDMSIGIACLLTQDATEARDFAGQLDSLNRDRRAIEQDMQRDALNILERFIEDGAGEVPNSICLYQSDWHQGVVGIVASRIKERMHRPTIAFADGDEGMLKGSARSIPGLHIRDALERVASLRPNLLDKFGGHAMAAGLSLRREDLEAFRLCFEQEVTRLLGDLELHAVVHSDGELESTYLELGLARELRYAAPWGQHFPEPVFDGVFRIVQQRIVGERHLKLVLSPEEGDQVLDAIAFNVDTAVWPDTSIERVRVAYRLDCNYFRGTETLQLMLEHLEPC